MQGDQLEDRGIRQGGGLAAGGATGGAGVGAGTGAGTAGTAGTGESWGAEADNVRNVGSGNAPSTAGYVSHVH